MSDLASNTCEACRIDAPVVSDHEASMLIKEIEGWDLINDGIKKLKKEFSFANYSDSVDFSNKAIESLSNLKNSVYKEALISIAHFSVYRNL